MNWAQDARVRMFMASHFRLLANNGSLSSSDLLSGMQVDGTPHTDRQPSAGDLQAKATQALTQHSDRVTQGRSHQVPTSIQTLY